MEMRAPGSLSFRASAASRGICTCRCDGLTRRRGGYFESAGNCSPGRAARARAPLLSIHDPKSKTRGSAVSRSLRRGLGGLSANSASIPHCSKVQIPPPRAARSARDDSQETRRSVRSERSGFFHVPPFAETERSIPSSWIEIERDLLRPLVQHASPQIRQSIRSIDDREEVVADEQSGAARERH